MMKKRNLSLIAVLIIATAAILVTLYPFAPRNKYQVDRYIDKELQDTLMANVVTFMGEKPRYADFETRHEAQYRGFYVEQSKGYSFYKYFVDSDNRHYFYIIRPARHALLDSRAIGGWMKLDEKMNILDYYEVFVTNVMEEDTLKNIAAELFKLLINNKLERLDYKHPRIEWPDDRLKYHPVKKEWRYDMVDN